tara:strand:+ start:831 stop:1478 length:648 start_codon:yes stop_codon:yes gene_type:complete
MKKINFLRILILLIAFPVFSGDAFAQEENKILLNVGGEIGISAYTVLEENVRVNSFFKSSANVEIVGLFEFSNVLWIKTGVGYTYYKSPVVNGQSAYDELIQIPILFSFLRPTLANSKNTLVLSAGPMFSVLAAQGLARVQDEFFLTKDGMFGGFYKFGLISEIAIYTPKVKFLNSYGFKFSMDIPSLTIISNKNAIVHDNYITGTFFLNINRRL